MSRRQKRYSAGVRLDEKERVIVRYIVSRLELAYRNTAGKPVYARNMDQVMKDIFGMKKFTKTLRRARSNEALMIQLMTRLDTATLWQICRSEEHYRLLCTLVALDNYIVESAKKYDKLQNLEQPSTRNLKKMKTLKKNVKKARKLYGACIKTFRNIFDIKKINDGGNAALFDSLEDWLDRHDGGDDIFFGFDDFSRDDVESMDAYIRGLGKSRGRSGGALGLDFDDYGDDPDGIFGDSDDEDSDEDLLRELANRGYDIRAMLQRQPVQRRSNESIGRGIFDDEPDDDDPGNDNIERILNVIASGFDSLGSRLDGLYEVPVNGGGRPTVGRSGGSLYSRPSAGGPTLSEMVAMSNPGDEEDDGIPDELSGAPVDAPAQNDGGRPTVGDGAGEAE